jgi:release factor glutamine methyltransferase
MIRLRLPALPRLARQGALSLPEGCCPDVESCLARGTLLLEQAGIETARLDAECLVAAVLSRPRWEVALEPRRRLTVEEFGRILRLLERRERREPLAYILGTREFWSLPFAVSLGVLVPRPETETLVEATLEAWGEMRDESHEPRATSHEPRVESREMRATSHEPRVESRELRATSHEPRATSRELRAEGPGPRAERQEKGPVIVELCTGSGAVAVALATELPAARVLATDVSWRALRVARANAARHGVAERITFLRGDLWRAVNGQAPAGSADLVVANPPYIPTGELPALMPEVQWEPRMALDGGADGLRVMREILATSPDRIRPGGFLLLEIGAEQADAVRALVAASDRWEPPRVRRDLAGRPRVVVARRRGR